MRLRVLIGAVPLVAVAGVASAQQTAPAKGPELALALEAAQAAISTCIGNGSKASAAVVDSGGVLRVLLSVDGASAQSVEFATKKAFTANALKAATYDMQQKMKADPALAAKLNADSSLRVTPGGLPLLVGNDVIGAIGVGGSSTLNGVSGGERDAICAKAGIDRIKDRLK